MAEKHSPHYDLDKVRLLVQADRFDITARVSRHVRGRGWQRETVSECLLEIKVTDLHKSQQHRERSDQWLDIYRPTFRGLRMYVKFTVDELGEVYVLSFCLDGEAH